jgi:hypothetical protein
MRTGYAHLPLHTGKAPAWLFSRMVRLSREVLGHIVAEYGSEEVLRRLSDPFWFQSFGCVLGFDWHSSGVTTTVCGAVKEAVRGQQSDFGFYVAGGKGKTSRLTPAEVTSACEVLGSDPAPLVHASRLAAKVDNSAVQDGYQLYQHTFIFLPDGRWCVVQQGMNEANHMARRYHWLSEGIRSFVEEPHAAVCCDDRGRRVLNLVAQESGDVRLRSVQLASYPGDVLDAVGRTPLLSLPRRHRVLEAEDVDPRYLEKILVRTYDRRPATYEALLEIEGVGPKTLRALALASELIYGSPLSMRDPARFSFAHGGKDGFPYPVDRQVYENTISVLKKALERGKIDRSEKVLALKRLARVERASAFDAHTPLPRPRSV